MSVEEIKRQIRQLKHELKCEKKRISVQKVKKMSKQERIDATWKLDELSPGLWDLLRETGTMTGSVVYGDKAKANDYDYCIDVPPTVFTGYALGTEDTGYFEQDGFTSIYAHYDGQLVNILCFGDYALYEAWVLATKNMVSLRTSGGFKTLFNDKWRRVRVFRALRDACYTPRELDAPRSFEDSQTYRICVRCGSEAINFIDRPSRDAWRRDGICDRCR